MATSFVLIFHFENSHYINITLVFIAKTKNKIINPKTSIYLFTVPMVRMREEIWAYCDEKKRLFIAKFQIAQNFSTRFLLLSPLQPSPSEDPSCTI